MNFLEGLEQQHAADLNASAQWGRRVQMENAHASPEQPHEEGIELPRNRHRAGS